MNRKPAPEKKSDQSLHDWSNLKLMLLEDALSKENSTEVLVIADYPLSKTIEPNSICDLISGINQRFSRSFYTKVCEVHNGNKSAHKAKEVCYTLDTRKPNEYNDLVEKINSNIKIKLVVLHYELSVFPSINTLTQCLTKIKKPVAIVFDSLFPVIENCSTKELSDLINTAARVIVHTDYECEQIIKHCSADPTKTLTLPNTPAAFAHIFKSILGDDFTLRYNLPPIDVNILSQSSQIRSEQRRESLQYECNTLDNNVEILAALCMYYEHTRDKKDLHAIVAQLNFVDLCFNPIDFYQYLSHQNEITLGKAICNLGYLYSRSNILNEQISEQTETLLLKTLRQVDRLQSPYAIAHAIKGLYFYFTQNNSFEVSRTIERLADKLANLYIKNASISWSWFEESISYSHCILAEALLFAYLSSHKAFYKKISITAFDFFIIKAFNQNSISATSNKSKFPEEKAFEEDNIKSADVTSIIQSLSTYYEVFKDECYQTQMEIAFSWFLGNNAMYHSVYNVATGECNDSLPKKRCDNNQSTEAATNYLVSRLILEKHFKPSTNRKVTIAEETKSDKKQSKPLRKKIMLNYLVKFSVMVMVILIMVRKVFLSKPLEPALFEQ